MSRHLIAGASGFVGASLARRLLDLGAEVHVLLRPSSNPWRLQDILGRLVVHTGDLVDLRFLETALRRARPRFIHNLATYGGHTAERDEEGIRAANVKGVRNLLLATRHDGEAMLLHAGSSSEYGPCVEPMREDMVPHPVGAYAIAKAEATRLCLSAAREYGRSVVVLRLFSPFGPFDSPDRMIPSMILAGLAGRTPFLRSGRQVRDYVWIGDVCEAFIHCTSDPSRVAGQVLNIGSGVQRGVAEVAAAAVLAAGGKTPPAIQPADLPPFESPVWVADMTRTRRVLGWAPEFPFKEAISSTADWFCKHRHFYEK